MILRNFVSISEKDWEYIAITHTKIRLKRTLNNPHSLTLNFFISNKNQIILVLLMEVFANEIQQDIRYWGNLQQIFVLNIVCLQSDYIKGLVSCMYAFLSFTIMKFIKVFCNVSQLHTEKQASISRNLPLNFFNKMFYKTWSKHHAEQKQKLYYSRERWKTIVKKRLTTC